MKRFLVKGLTVAMLGAVLAFLLAAPAFAQTTPTTGQPGASAVGPLPESAQHTKREGWLLWPALSVFSCCQPLRLGEKWEKRKGVERRNQERTVLPLSEGGLGYVQKSLRE